MPIVSLIPAARRTAWEVARCRYSHSFYAFYRIPSQDYVLGRPSRGHGDQPAVRCGRTKSAVGPWDVTGWPGGSQSAGVVDWHHDLGTHRRAGLFPLVDGTGSDARQDACLDKDRIAAAYARGNCDVLRQATRDYLAFGPPGPAAVIRGCHDTSTKYGRRARNHGSFRRRPWATTNAHADTSERSSGRPPATSGPSANAAATSRDTAAATRWTPSLALVARSLALEWPTLGLGSG